MNIRNLATGLKYCGEVSGKKQTYYVFESKKQFVVMSQSRSKPNSGYFNLVSKDAVDHVRRGSAGRQDVTAKKLATRARTGHVKNALHALNILYVLVATGAAARDDRFRDRELHFNVHAR